MVAFSAMLREGADPDRLGEDLVGVVSETLQPGQVPLCRVSLTALNPNPNVASP